VGVLEQRAVWMLLIVVSVMIASRLGRAVVVDGRVDQGGLGLIVAMKYLIVQLMLIAYVVASL
jgi:hypothetical protein